jgi:hypothetical protein
VEPIDVLKKQRGLEGAAIFSKKDFKAILSFTAGQNK